MQPKISAAPGGQTAPPRARIVSALASGAPIFFLALSLLAVLPAPFSPLSLLAVIVTEWGHRLAIVPLALLLLGWRASRAGRLGAAAALTAAVLLIVPVLRATLTARRLTADLEQHFGPPSDRASLRTSPLAVRELWLGASNPVVTPTTRRYAIVEGEPLSVDFYGPRISRSPDPAPIVVVVHGGSWQGGTRAEFPALNRYLANHGYLVAAIDYRLSPRWPFPAALEDVNRAIQFVRAHAAEHRGDAIRLAIIGRSAGAELALLAAYTRRDPFTRAVVSLYGPTDLGFAYAHPSNPLVLDSREVLERYLGGPPTGVPAAYDAASPITFVGAGTPPTLLIHGGRDQLVQPAQSERLAARLQGADRPHLLIRLPWATHGCDFVFSGPCGEITTFAIERFLASTMHGQSQP